MLICILGRQPKIGLAELESLYGAQRVSLVASNVALLDLQLDQVLQRPLGGTMKIAEVIETFPANSWRSAAQKSVKKLEKILSGNGKITFGISTYGFTPSVRDVQKTGLILKQKLKHADGSVRLVPQDAPALNTAQVLHNKLGSSPQKQEIIITGTHDGQTILATTKHVQDIDAYTFRDRSRPRRDAYIGMLPPKLAQIMINLAGTPSFSKTEAHPLPRLLDPFCGTGVILQEAALMHYSVYGTDLNEKMIRYTRDNLNWLQETHHMRVRWYLHEGDATETQWQQPIDAVVSETYLGQPFDTEPSPEKLRDVSKTCDIITRKFLENIAPQLAKGTPLCLAIPAWHTKHGVQRLQLLDSLEEIGYNRKEFTHVSHEDLLYHREGQVVGRELLVLIRSS